MMRRPILLATVVAAALVAGGCAQTGPQNRVELFEATLTGANEVPPNNSTATGTAEVRLNEAANTITWKVLFSGLSGPATGGHIHGPAGPDQNAGVQVPFGNLVAQPIAGEARITPEQVNQLTSGQWYVNIHSQRFPGGEIRGQLRPRR